MLLAPILASLLVLQPETPAPEPFPSGYLDAKGLGEALHHAAAARPQTIRLQSLAHSQEGRDVWLVTAGHAAEGAKPPRPAILIVANLEADHVVGSQVAAALVRRLAENDGKDADITRLLDSATLYIIPRLNPDGVERLLNRPRLDLRTNLRPLDRDRDGRRGEDGPDDLDGDGEITSLLVPDRRASLIPDEKDPRLLHKADPAKGEQGRYSQYVEGKDDDHDGGLNEDPPGGVNLNRNWPYRWTEYDLEAGPTPVSEPEVRPLIQFAIDHPEIVAVLSFGLNDNLREPPKKQGSSQDDADLPHHVGLAEAYGKLIGTLAKDAIRPGAPVPPAPEWPKPDPATGPIDAPSPAAAPLSLDGTTDGALSEWAYHHFGVLGLSCRLWYGPDFGEPAKDQPAPPKEGEARWLYWNDHVVGGRAFVPFAPLRHPTLGPVLVGGWKPGVRTNPPVGRVEPIADAQLRFLEEIAGRFPSLALSGVEAKALGGGLFEVRATVENRGRLPTALVQGVRLREAPPVLVRLEAQGATVLNGPARSRVDRLDGRGGHREFRWLVQAPKTVASVTIEASCLKAGRVSQAVALKPEEAR